MNQGKVNEAFLEPTQLQGWKSPTLSDVTGSIFDAHANTLSAFEPRPAFAHGRGTCGP